MTDSGMFDNREDEIVRGGSQIAKTPIDVPAATHSEYSSQFKSIQLDKNRGSVAHQKTETPNNPQSSYSDASNFQ